MSAFDLWANLKYLSPAKLIDTQPEGWEEVIAYVPACDKASLYWDEGVYYLQDGPKILWSGKDFWAARKVGKALVLRHRKTLSLAEEDLRLMEEYYSFR